MKCAESHTKHSGKNEGRTYAVHRKLFSTQLKFYQLNPNIFNDGHSGISIAEVFCHYRENRKNFARIGLHSYVCLRIIMIRKKVMLMKATECYRSN